MNETCAAMSAANEIDIRSAAAVTTRPVRASPSATLSSLSARVRPDAAFFSEALGEFILPYDAVRAAAQPDQTLLEFLQSTYEAAANAAKWDRDALECPPGQPGVVRVV